MLRSHRPRSQIRQLPSPRLLPRALHRSYPGGAFAEPLIHNRVFDMVAYAHKNGIIDSRIITNGLLLNKYFDQIFDSGLVNLFVSIDAFSEDKYREIRGFGATPPENA